jgi:glutamine amidotransferase
MCRLAAWVGAPIRLEDVVIAPRHSLLDQSQDATEAKLAVNGDGFGLAWYRLGRETPGIYRDVLPAWGDENLLSLCQMIEAPLFLAHVRAATGGGTARENCHPFRFGRWCFMHNGQLADFPRRRRSLEAELPDALYEQRRGSSDSEVLFLLLLAFGLEHDPYRAVQQLLSALEAGRASGGVMGPDRATCVFSDGDALYAFRYASDGKCPTLYQRRAGAGTVLASEPLDGECSNWSQVPPGHLLKVTRGEGRVTPIQMVGKAA